MATDLSFKEQLKTEAKELFLRHEVGSKYDNLPTLPTSGYYSLDADIYFRNTVSWVPEPHQQHNDPASNAEILLVKEKTENLLVVIGESWTYPDSLHGVSAYEAKDNPIHRIENAFWSHMAKDLDCDILVSAKPGHSNYWHIKNLKRIKEQFSKYFVNYKNVYIVFQLTSPFRDLDAQHNKLYITENFNSNSKQFFDETVKYISDVPKWSDTKLDIKDLDLNYDNFYIKLVEELTSSLPNTKTLIWKNFNFFKNNYKPHNIHLVSMPWVQLSAKLANLNMPNLPNAMESYAFDTYKNFKNYNTSKSVLLNELDSIDVIQNFYSLLRNTIWHNGSHPSEINHKEWAAHLLNDSKWTNKGK